MPAQAATAKRLDPDSPPLLEPGLRLHRAQQHDAPALKQLLASSVPECSVQTVWNIPWTWQHYRALRDIYGNPVAIASLQPTPRDSLELRGVTVDRRYRGQGLASKLLTRLLREANADVLCRTQSPDFFAAFGFVPTTPWWVQPQRRSPNPKPTTALVRPLRRFPRLVSSAPNPQGTPTTHDHADTPRSSTAPTTARLLHLPRQPLRHGVGEAFRSLLG